MSCSKIQGSMQSADTEQPRKLTLEEQRLRIQQLERQTQAEYSAAKEILENDQKAPRGGRTLSRSLPKPGLSMESIVEREKRRRCTLIEQHNGLQCSVRGKGSQLLEMEQAMKALVLDSNTDGDEQHYDQRVRELENSLEKMTIKITEAERIQKTYLQVCDHLHREVREMPMALDQLQNSVVSGQTELGKVAHMSHTAVAAVDCTKLVQMERQLMVERRMMEKELSERRGVKEKEVEGRLEREREGERRSSKGAQKLKEQVRRGTIREGLAEETAHIRAQQTTPVSSTPQSIVKLVEDIDALREALSCTDLQELETRLVSQKAIREQLHNQMTQCEELVRQSMETLAALELQYAQLKFSVGPSSDRFERLKEEMQAELEQEEERCSHWEDKLEKAQSVLHGVEKGVNNLFFRMSCVQVKDSPRELGGLDAIEKLREIGARLPTLQTTASEKTEENTADHEKVWSFLEQSTMMEPRNYKRASSPVYDSTSEDTFQFRSQEEDCSMSREEIKRRSIQLIEVHQPKKKAQRSNTKS
ncbi:coiled-coil domain-containing protein 183 isoform X1 [Salmo salar]|uniref:Coiled-coil domain-containing protein 183 isoform X1 n=2 Tax=Salmo salar TaxID=8030 RepID=A0A1S3NPN2_SALSA|nr:coiled-coil domain-containing protein 183 isoform X1 [Salmo salar]|eukprot:XP_014017200.1 PREDICTED: coiled-coil domain-containing protein 183 isoform X1 [Salmo salar]